MTFNGPKQLAEHLRGARHRAAVAAQRRVQSPPSPATRKVTGQPAPASKHCELCEKVFTGPKQLAEHLHGARHRAAVAARRRAQSPPPPPAEAPHTAHAVAWTTLMANTYKTLLH